MNRILFAILVCAWFAAAEDIDAVKHKLIGTWKLVSYIREEIPSGRTSDVMGPHPSGYLIYGADGRMMVIFVHSDRKKPLGAVPNLSESEELLKGLVRYTGTYAVKGDLIVHHVDVSWNEAWTGTDQTRFYKFEGNRLSLATTKSLDPVEGKLSVRTLIWERVK
jgi:hypothetical protein